VAWWLDIILQRGGEGFGDDKTVDLKRPNGPELAELKTEFASIEDIETSWKPTKVR